MKYHCIGNLFAAVKCLKTCEVNIDNIINCVLFEKNSNIYHLMMFGVYISKVFHK